MRGSYCQWLDGSLCAVVQRGLAPRVFEYIFKRIAEEEDNAVSLAPLLAICYVVACCAGLCCGMLCYAERCCVMLCCAELYCRMLCCSKLRCGMFYPCLLLRFAWRGALCCAELHFSKLYLLIQIITLPPTCAATNSRACPPSLQ